MKIFPVDNWLNVLYGFTMAFIITKTNLIDISVVISRAFSYGLTIVFYSIGYISIFGLINYLKLDLIYQLFFGLLYLFFTALTFQWTRGHLQTGREKKYLQDQIKVQETLAGINELLMPVVGLDDFFRVLENIRINKIQADNIRVWLPETFANAEGQAGQWLEWKVEEGKPEGRPDVAARANEEAAWTRKPDPKSRLSEETIWVKRLFAQKVLHKEEAKEEFKKLGLEVCLACFTPKGPLAVVGFSRKMAESAYSQEELNFFTLLIPTFTMIFDRIKPFEELQEKVQAAQAMLEKSQNLAQLGTLSAGIAHEIRNPLGIILLKAERINGLLSKDQMSEEQKKEVKDAVARIIDHVQRTTRISENMLRLARSKEDQEAEMTQVDPAKFLNETIEMVDWAGVEVVRDYQEGSLIKADLVGLRQVFVNLLQNACLALRDKSLPENKPKKLILKARPVRREVEIEVTDTGAGIAPQNLDKIFDPFFTTRHEGVGVGLSICYRIIREHGGLIEVQSVLGQGTTFKITLPRESQG